LQLLLHVGGGWAWLDWTGYDSPGYIDTIVPVFVLAITFGLSMDYEVFPLTRIRERYLAGADNAEAVAQGLAQSARTITAAALIMVAVFGSFGLRARSRSRRSGWDSRLRSLSTRPSSARPRPGDDAAARRLELVATRPTRPPARRVCAGTYGLTTKAADGREQMLVTTDAWRRTFPGAVVGALIMRGVRNPEQSVALEAAKRWLEEDLRAVPPSGLLGYEEAAITRSQRGGRSSRS
jgi:hypothetical protein